MTTAIVKHKAGLAKVMTAFGDQTRLRILNLMGNGREVSVQGCVLALELSESTVAHHIGHLRDAGLIGGRREGRRMFYGLMRQPDALKPVIRSVFGTFKRSPTMQADLVRLLATGGKLLTTKKGSK